MLQIVTLHGGYQYEIAKFFIINWQTVQGDVTIFVVLNILQWK